MPFKTGISGNPKGRPKGKPNRTTDEIRTMLQDFISDNMETLQEDFDQLKPNERLTFIERMLKHVMPAPLQELERLTDEQLNEIINRLKNKDNGS